METKMKLSKSEVLFKFLKEDKSGIFAGSHDVATPQPLVEELITTIPDIGSNKTILVLFNVEFVISLVYNHNINTKNITFYSDNSNKTKFVNRMGVVNVITELDTTMKFDVVVGNPPYSGTLHLEFIKKCHKLSDRVLMIHPAGWLFRDSGSIESETKKQINSDVKNITILQGNSEFTEASFACPLTITYLDKSHTGPVTLSYKTSGNSYQIDKLNNMPTGFWEPAEETKLLVDKFNSLSSKSNLYSIVSKKVNSFSVTAPRVVGHGATKDSTKMCDNDFWNFFYTNSDLKNFTTVNKAFTTKSSLERTYLISYLRTKFARFGLYINKVTQDLYISRYMESIPLPPLDRNWTDSELAEYYSLTPSESALIDSLIPNYQFKCD